MKQPDDLSNLYTETTGIELTDGTVVCIEPITLEALPAFLDAYAELYHMPEGDFEEERGFLRVALHEDYFKLIGEADMQDIVRMVGGVMDANKDLLFPADGEDSNTLENDASESGIPWNWADAMQTLVSNGHPPETIKQYTVAQARFWLTAIDRLERRKQVADMTAIRQALSSHEQANEYMSGLLQ
jgi:hypothetical protein